MRDNNIVTQPQSNDNRISRREILASLAADDAISRRQLLPNLLAAITLAGLGAPDVQFVQQAPPYGPAERTAILDQWLGRIDEVMAGLSEYRRIIALAHGLPPAEVDGVKLVNLESEAHRLADDLIGWIDCDYENDLISNATGRASSAVCVEAELTSDSHVFDRDFWQREVDAVSGDHPEERARLQALLNARYEGVL